MPSAALAAISDRLHQRVDVLLAEGGDALGPSTSFSNCSVTVFWVSATKVSTLAVASGRAMMVGNSLRSDVLPVLGAGGWGVHVPHPLTWSHEAAEVPESHLFRAIPDLGALPGLVGEFGFAIIPPQWPIL